LPTSSECSEDLACVAKEVAGFSLTEDYAVVLDPATDFESPIPELMKDWVLA